MSDEASPIRILVDKTSRIRQETIDPINSGETAGFAVLHLMQKTQQDIPPHDIVELPSVA